MAPNTSAIQDNGPPPIRGVATTVAAFVDVFARGPLARPIHITSFAAFERLFGGLHPSSEASYAIHQFFFNGGAEAYVVGVPAGSDTYFTSMLTAALDPESGALGRKSSPFNILCVPATMRLPDKHAAVVAQQAIALCTERRAFYILDTPQHDAVRDTPTAMLKWLDDNGGLRSRNAAIYFPRLKFSDPREGYEPRIIAPSGTLAGVYVRSDLETGVWKAPAGATASLQGIAGFTHNTTDAENESLNSEGVNCLRSFHDYGPVAWGARTLVAPAAGQDDYKYISVRRLTLYIEESLLRGLRWAVFEPNDATLWSALTQATSDFMAGLYAAGAFMGATASQAYYVRCDATTTAPTDIADGFVNLQVAFAPVYPAEFVVLTIRLSAGASAS